MKPRALKPGDTVALVSPASPISEDALTETIALLEGEGYKVKTSPHALADTGAFAGSDKERARDLQDAFDDPQVAAILCTRGGYGCARLMPLLDLNKMAAQPKIFAGFSDITTLHLALNRRGLPTLHAPMALTLHYPRPDWVLQNFKEALRGNLSQHPDAPRAETLVGGKAQGVGVGGCLCLLCDSIATPDPLDAEGKILFIEDVDELPHRIDAMLTHLRNCGMIQKAAGIVIGEMTRTDEQPDEGTPKRPWREIISDRIADLNVPTVINFPFGHMKEMLTVGLGLHVRLDADTGRIEYLEPFCA